MNIHKIELSGYTARVAGCEPLCLGTAGSRGNETLQIVLGDGWQGLSVQAVFHPAGVACLVPEDGLLAVPWEATDKPLNAMQGRIVFQGLDGSGRVVNSTDAAYQVAAHSPTEGAAGEDPTPSLYEQFVGQVLAAAGTASAELKPGDIVVYQGMTGTLESVSKNRARFTANGMTFTVDPSQLRRSDASRISIPRRSGSSIDRILTDRAAHTTTRLNIIGMTVAEAIPVVDKFLSDAVMAHLSQVTIVHGMGTFALRNGIWDHLRRVKIVKSFHEAGESQGAMGATVVDLR